ncbi:C-type lectin 37Db-like [Drosophila virilis]|uniref:C-type lectin 37Db-like n=1 Tax=Drosophila virilis TaxID=7244 RepID=UPI00017D3F0A|nr:C-type lectin 37Db-like [Drosophila virilis]XP_032293642.1 C-type lectin 37Db-like [Drosophila virilis]XP_032293643.1 C-type lectin 37Db-like [Drosophila virilis]XP_032293644.1 C-type lectin 37Db-like [Drosophila virilis]
MDGKLIFLLFSMQLWHFSISSEIPDVLVHSSELGKCVSSCKDFPIKIGNKLYHIESKLKVNWFQAAENCRKWGGHLLNIENSIEMDVIVSIVPANRFWTSANCLAEPGNFISIATGEAMPYYRWKAGLPDNESGNEYCAEVAAGGLNDEVCETLLNYVCQANIL